MRLWDFIQEKLKILGRNESWLVDRGGLTQITVNRIKAGGVIKDSTKQKLAMCLGCTIGDINDALSKQEPPERKAHDMDLLAKEMAPVGELPPEVKEVVDDMLNDVDNIVGCPVTRTPEKIPVKESALKYNMEQLKEEMAAEEYKQKLKDICFRQFAQAAKDGITDANIIYKAIGRILLGELMK